jgi:D-alanyl-D-alanine carboxypeptidase-like protein
MSRRPLRCTPSRRQEMRPRSAARFADESPRWEHIEVTAGRLVIGAISIVLMAACGAPGGEVGAESDAPRPSAAQEPQDLPSSVAGTQSASPSPVPEPPPRFEGGVYPIGPALRDQLVPRNWRPGCPIPIEDLRVVRVSYWDFEGLVRTGPLVLNERVARDVLWVFRQLFHAKFPIHRIGLPPRYRPPRPEDYENRRNLSSSFNCRPATGNTGSLSHHSYGWAVDINPLQNPYVRNDGSVLRRAAERYRDRTQHRRGMIHPGDVVVRSFAAIGWEWGGDWHTLKDYMHFSLTGK